MRVTRVHVPGGLQAGALMELPESAARHLTRVLRLAAGAPVILFDGSGGEHPAVIEQVGRSAVTVRVGEPRAVVRESPLDITLLQGIARGEKMDLILQKATELGVTRIVPLITARGNVRLNDESTARKQLHWQGVVTGACEQAGRNRIPEVMGVQALPAAVQRECAALKLLLAPDAQARSLGELLRTQAPGASIALLVGPEGGFDAEEIGAALRAGFNSCRLGPRVLRTETAALAALAALQFAAGDFG